MANRPKVLLIAEAANPNWPSVPLIGWSLSRAISNVADAHMVTHVRNREALLAAGLKEEEQFTAIDNEHVAAPAWKLADAFKGGEGKGWTTLAAFSAFAYYSFEDQVWQKFKSRLISREFDLVHRITPLSQTHQSTIGLRLSRLKIPFVLGPLNGGLPWPKGFANRQHTEREWLSYMRGAYRLMPYYRATRQYSSAIIVGSRHTHSEIPGWARDKCVFIPENGVDPNKFNLKRTRSAERPLKACFIGRLVAYKGADVLIEAGAQSMTEGELTIEIVGDGPEKSKLVDLAAKHNVLKHIKFHGWVPHERVQDILSQSDFLAFPSIREFGGGVVVEAMALGVASLVADYGGPSDLISEKTGLRVPFDSEKSLMVGFKHAIRHFVAFPELLDEMGAAALEKAKSLTWDAKAEQISLVYEAVLRGQKNFSGWDLFNS